MDTSTLRCRPKSFGISGWIAGDLVGPRVIQQILFLVLTPFAKLKGLKGSYPEYLARPATEHIPLDSLDRSGL